MQQDSYDIFEPNHLNSQNIIQENYYESDCSEASASSTSSATSAKSNNASIPWVLLEKFEDLALADAFVLASSTRDSTKPVCIYFNKLEVAKHKMLQQTRVCRSAACKASTLHCAFKFKYQRCDTSVWSVGDHPVDQIEREEVRRGIDEHVKTIIDDVLTKSFREIRPIQIFLFI